MTNGNTNAMTELQAIAAEALAALDTCYQISPFSARLSAFDLDDAYRVTAAIRQMREMRGEMPVGRKIGFTNRTAWPEYGPICEIVQSIFPGWKFSAPDAVAAFGLHGALLIGPRHSIAAYAEDWSPTLSTFEIDLKRDGTVVDHGRATNVLDGPVSALRHLVVTLVRDQVNPPLAAGEIVTTGTLTRGAFSLTREKLGPNRRDRTLWRNRFRRAGGFREEREQIRAVRCSKVMFLRLMPYLTLPYLGNRPFPVANTEGISTWTRA
jgi:2-keto-4-pentenoate hydratase